MIIFLQAAQSQWSGIIMILAMFAIIYFFMIRPQSKQQKALEQLRNNLTIGQDVITTGGLHGTVKAVADKTVTLRVASGVELVFEKNSIVSLKTQA